MECRISQIICLACLVAAGLISDAFGQGLAVDRQTMRWTVRDMVNEPQTTYLADTTLNRFIIIGQNETMAALRYQTSVVIDTIVTSQATIRYLLTHTAATQDTIMAGSVALVIHKEPELSGGNERALRHVPSGLIGSIASGDAPYAYSVVGRHLILAKSPIGDDTLFVYMNHVPADLSADSVVLSVSKEDQYAVAMYAAALACLRDKQLTAAQLYWQMWQQHVQSKNPLPQQVAGQ